ncbi:helix-turn-helix domain-containing protein [Aeromonas hydrophila]|uniref:AlpA family phage regulatory protein n=2 Tax=Aeromonadaceae TaxID=84642 RepID=A0AAN1URJ5_AERVE|nr:helix-turn-helix domain-containing protein [Aeromonas sp. Y301-2]AYV39025.1 AlpA family phage regulatory protein [Aeromonas veronii]EKP0261248.1 AlpA family phage regulatory protein [Aeromonas sobria]MDD9308022.1 helix-turn-helix domain-containing protein [Aeromonas hydrophila]MBE8735936.1 helix-turn-helix domain-containing protein [Aeromonas veronii]MBE8738828.1 helix-turn-helix domain-containing protein [Aeromonas veronii]
MGNNILDYLKPPAPEPIPIVKMKELCTLFGCSRMTIYRWMAHHKLPAPIRHNNKRLIGWDREAINTMLKRN